MLFINPTPSDPSSELLRQVRTAIRLVEPALELGFLDEICWIRTGIRPPSPYAAHERLRSLLPPRLRASAMGVLADAHAGVLEWSSNWDALPVLSPVEQELLANGCVAEFRHLVLLRMENLHARASWWRGPNAASRVAALSWDLFLPRCTNLRFLIECEIDRIRSRQLPEPDALLVEEWTRLVSGHGIPRWRARQFVRRATIRRWAFLRHWLRRSPSIRADLLINCARRLTIHEVLSRCHDAL